MFVARWALGIGLLAVTGAAPVGTAAPRLPPRPGDGLHEDAAVRAAAGPDEPPPAPELLRDYTRLPAHPVVKSGTTRARADVFRDLGLDVERTRDRRWDVCGKAAFVAWQVSASYDLVCMTAPAEEGEAEEAMFARDRPVYGVRIARRPSQPRK